jgi:hypothetical protein
MGDIGLTLASATGAVSDVDIRRVIASGLSIGTLCTLLVMLRAALRKQPFGEPVTPASPGKAH